ncbi:MAG TPA: patatin-like phospholipase family protein [Syntrophales bacterium]|nr:patatin-like phospholipase family protein [Syntrophales bacterium]HOX94076.1 patatin-like phospholipase family protein [Syntrophales bacterium]HPN24312.1 patatin-like phospholipase family protein [Syntrophales bacterium]HQM28664.1 patatin-like phospholipase family protein [Syntrophales bacterium]
MNPKVAIACQGGGSQTAFTAGVLKALFENNIQDRVDIVSLSGTSGGAICAFLIWYALRKGDDCVWKRLIDFWEDNTAQTPQERIFNDSIIKHQVWTSKGIIPQYNLSPSGPLVRTWVSLATLGMRRRFVDLKELLAAHIDFSECAAWGARPEPPILIIGACNILSGRLHKFNSRHEPMRIEHLLASACVPSIFPAVVLDEQAYWDGLFSDNPPIDSMLNLDSVGTNNLAQEIWVIKINPTTSDRIPVSPFDITDRRNELEGNVSLFQSLREIEDLNRMLSRGAFREEFLAERDIRGPVKIPKLFPEDPDQPYHIPVIEMSADLAKSLTYESKLDRTPENINRLILDGEKQGQKFIEARLRQMR